MPEDLVLQHVGITPPRRPVLPSYGAHVGTISNQQAALPSPAAMGSSLPNLSLFVRYFFRSCFYDFLLFSRTCGGATFWALILPPAARIWRPRRIAIMSDVLGGQPHMANVICCPRSGGIVLAIGIPREVEAVAHVLLD
jgi:hypothetical protein